MLICGIKVTSAVFIKWNYLIKTILACYLINYLLINRLTISVFFIKTPEIELTLINDKVILLFSMVVLWISILISKYSIDYIETDKYKQIFFILMTIFILSILILIISPNLLLLIVGWDGLGLSSFCLVIFFQNKSSINSGLITFLTNRLGDCFIISFIALSISNIIIITRNKVMLIQTMLVIIGAFTKRAQAPFSAWLPEAMAAPTPVSSLVHSSTLVTAGIYLITRFNMILKFKLVKITLVVSAMVTSILAGMYACKESDRKKIVAMSTLSQLGLIAFNLAINRWKLCLFHITTHAIFKALIFISTGINININIGKQEKRKIFIENRSNKIMMLSANISLIGVPFIRGFYSKDLILEFIMTKEVNIFTIVLFIFSCVITSFYSILLIKRIKRNKKSLNTEQEKQTSTNIMKAIKIIWTLILPIRSVINLEINNQITKATFYTKKIGILFILLATMLNNNFKKTEIIYNRHIIKIELITKKTLSTNINERFLKEKRNLNLSVTTKIFIKKRNIFSRGLTYLNKINLVWILMFIVFAVILVLFL